MNKLSKEKVLFITNQLFVDESKPEGGVRLCTYDFIELLKCRYEVVIFSLDYNKSFIYRLKAKIGVDVYEEYDTNKYLKLLANEIKKAHIKKVFINLSNALAITKAVKENSDVKVILCSHGNESGDFLHQTVRFSRMMHPLPRLFSSWRLGRVLQKELDFRNRYIDLVLSVSDIENSIEKWLGAKQTFMVPRVFLPDFISWNPIVGRIGFVSDLSHYPNYYGLFNLCKELQNKDLDKKIEIRVVGKSCGNLKLLLKEFNFISPLGYLNEEQLKQEAGSWMYYLNPVFYYSKGVSTKLAKGMNWGLPVLSTEAGNRGYIFKNGGVVTCKGAKDMANKIITSAFDKPAVSKEREKVIKAVTSFCSMNDVMNNLYPIIENL